MSSAGIAGSAPAVSPAGKTAPPDALSARALPALHASFHSIGHRGVLFDSASQKLYAVNRSAGLIWCCLAEGYTSAQAARALAQRTDTSIPDAERLVADAIRTWADIGLLRGGKRNFESDPGGQTARVALPARTRRARGGAPVGCVLHCGLLDSQFRLSVSDAALAKELEPVVAGFRASGPAPETEELNIGRVGRKRVSVHRGGTRWWIGPRAQLVPALHAILPRLALERSRSFPAIHAAAALGPRGAVVFPGASGSGKSTLAAALLDKGHKVLCDDTVVLNVATGHVRPVGPYLCLKAGSWGLVDAAGGMESGRSYRRPDGALVRFLPVDRQTDARPEPAPFHGFPVHAIVFPRYRPGSGTRLTRLGAAAALHRLTRDIDPIGNRLGSEQVEGIIRWVRCIDCYALTIDALDVAVKLMGRVLR